MLTSTEIKNNNNTLIRAKTAAESITKANVADQLDAGIDYTDQEKRPYKSYSAIIKSVTGSATPTIMENSIGAVVISGNINNFTATLLDAFPSNKTLIFASIANTSETGLVSVNVNATSKTTALIPFETNLEYTDSEIYIEIRVYN